MLDVTISGMAWVKRSSLEPHQLVNLRDSLTIFPKKTTDISSAEDPEPIPLFIEDERRDLFGIPRAYYLKNKSLGHNEIVRVSRGGPMGDIETLYSAVGPFKEQEDALRLLESKVEGQPWAGMLLKAGCVSEDTEIRVNRGGKGFRITIGDAFARWSGSDSRYAWDLGIETQIRAHVGDRIGLTRVEEFVDSGVKDLWLVTLESGHSVKVTRDHKFMVPGGSYASLDDGLSDGDYAIVDGFGKSDPVDRMVYRRLSWNGDHPYAHRNSIRSGRQRYCLEEHRAVAEAKLNGLDLDSYRDLWRDGDVEGLRLIDPSTHVVHHVNGDHEDNRPENLEEMTHSEHHRFHGRYENFGVGTAISSRIVGVEHAGPGRVYDVKCDGHHNFTANGIVVHNCGFGKTVVALEFARRLGLRTLVLVHKEFFLKQWEKQILWLMPDAKVGRIQQDRCDYENVDFSIGMIQSLSRDIESGRYPEEMYRAFGLVITDECFVGNTEVAVGTGFKRIDEIRSGDTVLNAVGTGFVKDCGSRLVEQSDLRIVRFEDGREEVCTGEHPFFTKSGWVKASDLKGESVLTFDGCIAIMRRHGECEKIYVSDLRKSELGESGKEVLFDGMLCEGEDQSSDVVRVLRDSGDEKRILKVLFDILFSEVAEGERRSFHEEAFSRSFGMASEESAREERGVDTHDGFKSDEEKSNSGEGIGCSQVDGAQAPCAWRQRFGRHNSSVDLGVQTGRGVGVGGADKNRSSSHKSAEIPNVLQGGCRERGEDDRRGGGRAFPLSSFKTGHGQEEGVLPYCIRVESVEIPKREDLERLGIGCEGDRVRVYNLTVSGHPSYVLKSGGVVHNCHRIGASSWSFVLPRFQAAYRLGLTATPRRKDGAQDVFFDHIGPIVYSARTEAMVPKLRRLMTTARVHNIDRGKYQVASGKLNSAQVISQLGENEYRSREIADDVATAVRSGRKIMIVSERLEHLRQIARQLNDVMMNMEFAVKLPGGEPRKFIPKIDFYTGSWFTGEVWEKTTKAHRAGDPKTASRSESDLYVAESANIIMATKQMVEEGLDIPAIDVIVLATPMSDIEQIVGRCRRWCSPAKKKCDHLCPWRSGACQKKGQPIVVDIVDENVSQAMRRWPARRRYYQSIGAL